ncbi:hypothetical protein [Streptomyces sp. NPDC093094]|uniref:hypothetical protein n=1 Tax=Streptomyces sp. NPDC093094 TaxID=3366026 RepID=UPI0037F15FE3
MQETVTAPWERLPARDRDDPASWHLGVLLCGGPEPHGHRLGREAAAGRTRAIGADGGNSCRQAGRPYRGLAARTVGAARGAHAPAPLWPCHLVTDAQTPCRRPSTAPPPDGESTYDVQAAAAAVHDGLPYAVGRPLVADAGAEPGPAGRVHREPDAVGGWDTGHSTCSTRSAAVGPGAVTAPEQDAGL